MHIPIWAIICFIITCLSCGAIMFISIMRLLRERKTNKDLLQLQQEYMKTLEASAIIATEREQLLRKKVIEAFQDGAPFEEPKENKKSLLH